MTSKECTITFSGEAGQGLNTIESLFMNLLFRNGYNAFSTKEFMSRVRGGNNTTTVRVSSDPVSAYVERIDILILLSDHAAERIKDRITSETIIIGEQNHLPSVCSDLGCVNFPVDVEGNLLDLGGKIFLNNFIIGILAGIFAFDPQSAREAIASNFKSKGDEIVEKNLTAFRRGIEASSGIPMKISVRKSAFNRGESVLGGTESIGIGAVAGGCNFIASYPMSPSTGLLAYLAKVSSKCGIIVEQAEDEIAAMNMMLGAWYAGARGIVTTSGGGFALMTEGVSLAGCVESPAVIHLAQRPGPATGLPTRTEQGDLNLALYAGHGEFPRVIYAPGKLSDGITLTQKAFDVADRYQVPVFILTDQYYLDSFGISAKPDFAKMKIEHHIVETKSDYKRYQLTDSGISPRGIPGHGTGLVALDSDEHDESGRITEDFNMRIAMTDKRMSKLNAYVDIEPEIIGNPDYSILIVGWGSTFGAISEALTLLQRKDVAFAYFSQVYPVPRSAKRILEKAKVRILVENNVKGQFGNLLKMETLLDFHKRILKYNGLPFSVEELERKISEALI